jgi:hypothetical protein
MSVACSSPYTNRFAGRAAVDHRRRFGPWQGRGRAYRRRRRQGRRCGMSTPTALKEAAAEVGAVHSIALDVSDPRGRRRRGRRRRTQALGKPDRHPDCFGRHHRRHRPRARLPDRQLEARRSISISTACSTARARGHAVHDGRQLRPDRQRRLGGRQGRQSQRLRLFGVEGRGDRPHQVAGQGTGHQGRHRQQHHPRHLREPDPGAAAPEPGRLHARQDPDGTSGRSARNRRHGLLHGLRGMQRSPPPPPSTRPAAGPPTRRDRRLSPRLWEKRR